MRPAPALLALALSACAHAPPPAPNPWTQGVRFAAMSGAEKAEAAVLTGSQAAAGLYTIRVRLGAGGHIAPHSHPDARVLTVVSGEVWYGFGETMDPANARRYPAGAVFVVPANAPHWSKADAEAVYQEAGMGPSAFVPVQR